MKTIYRIENDDQKGYFRNNNFDDDVVDNIKYKQLHNRHQRYMESAIFIRIFEIGIDKCAYCSLTQLRRMVSVHELIFLRKLGFKVVKITTRKAVRHKSCYREGQMFFKEKDVICRKYISG